MSGVEPEGHRSTTLINRRNFVTILAVAAANNLMPASACAATEGERGQTGDAALKHIRAGVLDVAYLDSGPSDGPPVVLLHGFPYGVRSYDDVARRLADAGRHVIVPYLRGYGPTRFIDAATRRVGQQAALGNDLIALLDTLNIQLATLAGFDWGSRAACVMAALHPERVSSLISSGGPGYNIQNLTEFLKPRNAEWERNHWFYYYLNSQRGRAAFSSDPTGFCHYLWQDFSPTWHFSEATFEQTATSFKSPDSVAVASHSYRNRIGALLGDPALESEERQLFASPKITVPTIVIEGADEGVDPPDAPETIEPYFTTLRRTTLLKVVGHNAPQEAPDLFAGAILEFDF